MAAEFLTPPRRGYVDSRSGPVHYRVAGSGPPIVLLHDSPRSSAMHGELMQALADEFTTIALDTPGYGNSAPLPAQPQPAIPEFARALGDALDALGLPACPVYGLHASSKIALELAVSRPERVSAAILDGLSLPPGPPDADLIARYALPLVPGDDGGYLVTHWTRVRDLHRFSPWFRRECAARLRQEAPDDATLQGYGLDAFLAGAGWSSACSAALRYAALPAVARLTVPTVILARADDLLYRHLDAPPQPLPAGCRIERLGTDVPACRARLRALFREFGGEPTALSLPDPLASPEGGDPRLGYVDRPGGQLRVRRFGAPGRRPVLLLHETPGGATVLEPFARALATDRPVIVPDLPGSGDSDPLPTPDVDGYADALRDLVDALAPGQFDVVAELTATPLAIELARRLPDRVARLVLDGVFVLTAAERRELWRRYCPKIPFRTDGAHLVTLWHRLRDQQLAWPWYDGRREAIRAREPRLDAATLHAQMIDTLKQLDHYGDAANAAFDYPVKERLEEVHAPMLLPAVDGDPRYRWTEKLRRQLGTRATVVPRPAETDARATAWRAFLDG